MLVVVNNDITSGNKIGINENMEVAGAGVNLACRFNQ